MSGYKETLSDCIDEAAKYLDDAKAVLLDPHWRERFEHVSYETTASVDFCLASLKGKPTRKYFHVNIYRLESGRYELTCYIL